ncbi:MAG: SCO family protein [Burkholderiales bacterium]|nr:SCO family protein [Burkholderiales bacterium]
MTKRRWLGAVALLLLVGGVLWVQTAMDKRALPDGLRAVIASGPMKFAPVQLTNQHGQTVTESWFTGQWTFFAFGFTHCPDVCIATLTQFVEIKKALAQRHPKMAPPRYVFISVDPERDTPARLATYLSAFDRSFIGMTGTAAQIEALERSMATFHRKQTPSASGDYQVSHSGEIFLLDPAGRVYARFVPPLETSVVAGQLNSIMTLYARETEQRLASRT